MAWDDAGNYERAEGLSPIYREIAARRDRAASLIAVVSDEGVREAADEVYESWAEWVHGETDMLVNALDKNHIDPRRPISASKALADSVRSSLKGLEK